MKPWKPLFALACIAFAVSPASASVLYKGLQYSSQGACVVDVDGDGKLHASNIGSSGQDGLTVALSNAEGGQLALDGTLHSSDAGARVTFTYAWSLVSRPPASCVTRCACVCQPGYLEMSAHVQTPLQTSPPDLTVTLYRKGVLVFTTTVADGSPVQVSMDATGACPMPTLFGGAMRSDKRSYTGGRFALDIDCVVGGVHFTCDDVVFSRALSGGETDVDCGGAYAQLLVSNPPGGSLSQVLCADGSCRVLSHMVSCTGQAALDLPSFTTPSSGARRLPVHNLGSSGQDGVEMQRDWSYGGGGSGGSASGPAVAERFASPSLVFDPVADEGASSVITLSGEAFSSDGVDLGAASASLQLTVQGHNFRCIPSHAGVDSDQEWVAVYSHGLEVARCLLPPGAGSVLVTPPPGEPLGMAINEKGLPGDKKPKKKSTALVASVPTPNATESAALSSSRGIAVDIRRPLHVVFADVRDFSCTGMSASGDELVCWTESSTATPAAAAKSGAGVETSGDIHHLYDIDLCDDFVTCPNPASPLSTLTLLDLATAGGDPIQPSVSGSTSLSSTHTCVSVPMVFTRTDVTPVRGFSVAFHLSPELAMCGAGVVEGDYLSKISDTQMLTHDYGGGAFSVDCSILGPVCGATGDGTLFSLNLASTVQSSGTYGVITVDSVRVRDCTNHVVAADAGSPGYIPIVTTSPPALSGLVAVQDKLGNPPGETTLITVSFPALTSVTSSLELFAKGYGNYPLYDNGPTPGSVPSPPASSSAALSSGWTPVTCGSSCSTGVCSSTCTPTSMVDSEHTRDYLYYCAFVRDLYGNESPVSNMTPGTLDYHLGDTSDGHTVCTGDNQVSLVDVSLLGAHYGVRVTSNDSWSCLDVGPTTDFSVDGRPTTDGQVEFEDFMMVAINYSVVSAPTAAGRPVAMQANASQLVVPALPAPGGTFDVGVMVDGAGDVQGMSARLAFDPSVLEQVGVSPGALLDQQGRQGAVLSSAPGTVDAALLGVGPGIAGHGELARVTFRVKSAGDPNLSLASITARDASNHPVAISGAAGGSGIPARTALGFAYPNPFREAVAIQLSLHRAGPAAIGVYDVAGRRVRSLVRGFQDAGARVITWDGRDDSGMRLAPGAYIVRLETSELRESRTVRLVR